MVDQTQAAMMEIKSYSKNYGYLVNENTMKLIIISNAINSHSAQGICDESPYLRKGQRKQRGLSLCIHHLTAENLRWE